MARVTLQTIADRLGVSRMTVSNAFSQPHQLSEQLRARILAMADELGYAGPDPSGRALARGTTGAVGVLLTDSLHEAFSDEVVARFLGAIADELGPTGFAITLLTSSDRADVVPARDVAFDGALIYSCTPRSTAKDWLLRRRLPLVVVDGDPIDDMAAVNIDDRGGAHAAARHVVELGHRHVGIVSRSLEGAAGIADDVEADAERFGHPQRERLLGWCDALGEAGITPTIALAADNSDAAARAAARHLLTAPQRPTAVLCYSDLVALNVIAAATELGLAVPADLSVVGFDDAPAAARAAVGLTTVHQDVVAKGRAAAAALVAAITARRAGTTEPAQRFLLPTELVVRATTAAP